MIPLLLAVMVGCRSHKEADIHMAETTQTQTAETIQTRTDSRTETSTEQAERADSIVWTVSADSVVQTKADGTREVLHRVRWTRTAYKPTATAKAMMTAQRTDTTSAVTRGQMQRQTAIKIHSESHRGGRPWWLPLTLIALSLANIACIIYNYRRRDD
mgnify:CR=1 FL=1